MSDYVPFIASYILVPFILSPNNRFHIAGDTKPHAVNYYPFGCFVANSVEQTGFVFAVIVTHTR